MLGNLPDFDPNDVVESEVIEHEQTTNESTLARQVALQVLYEIDSSGHQPGDVLTQHMNYHDLEERGVVFLTQLVQGVSEYRAKLDTLIQQFAPEFPLKQVAIVDRNVLRMAVYEIAIYQKTPVRVVIDEAVQLAKLFGADGSQRFVNGVLGAVMSSEIDLNTVFRESENDA